MALLLFYKAYFLILVPEPIIHNLHCFFMYGWKEVSEAQKYFI